MLCDWGFEDEKGECTCEGCSSFHKLKRDAQVRLKILRTRSVLFVVSETQVLKRNSLFFSKRSVSADEISG